MVKRPATTPIKDDIAGNTIDGTDAATGGNKIELGQPFTVDPLSAVADDTSTGTGNGDNGNSGDLTPTGRQRRKYGRRNASVGSSPQEKIRVDVLSQLLISSHLMIAAATDIEELKLNDEEAKLVADAYSTLAEFYPALQQSPKTIATINFISALGWVYGTRAVAIYNARKPKSETTIPGRFPDNVRVVQ